MKIWILTATKPYGDKTKLVHAFESEAEARRIIEIIDACDPRMVLDLEEVEFDRTPFNTVPKSPMDTWKMSGVAYGISALPQSPAANFAAPTPGATGAVTDEEPMDWPLQDGR